MSLILKGIDLPTDENKPLIVEIWASGTVWEEVEGDYMCMENSAIQIPKDHGIIIDGGKLIERLKSDNPQTSKNKWMSIVTECAPTILEAEE